MTAEGDVPANARPDDVGPFLEIVRDLGSSEHEALRDLLAVDEPSIVARAPGRLDVMGGIADYSGSLVLQLPIAEATFAVAQRGADANVRVASLPEDGTGEPQVFTVACAELERLAQQGYPAMNAFFRRDASSRWAAYVVGTMLVLARERGVPLPGLRLLIGSRVPAGKGVSSSAALEVATMQAVAELLGVALDGTELATLCQLCENRVVGAPCGIMDQMTAALGQPDRLLALLCQPAVVRGHLAIPPGIRFWGIDSGVRHEVSGADYTSVRVGAFMGYRILADLLGFEVTGETGAGHLSIADPRFAGHLANCGPDEFARLAEHVPQRLGGRAFLARYGGITDSVTRVAPDREYAVWNPTAHPIEEHARVRRFTELLPAAGSDEAATAMGELMYASHDSYSACGLGSVATDRLVALVRTAGPRAGLFGAKITGGGSGGTVAVLGRADADSAIADIARRYASEIGRPGKVFDGSSPGACAFGVLRADCLTDLR